MALTRLLPCRLFVATLITGGFLISPLYVLAAPLQLMLTWQDASTNESGFVIERRLGPSSTSTAYAPVGQASQGATSYVDTTGLAAGSTYCYRVQAFNSSGPSPYSNEACGTVPNPSAPVSVSVSVVNSGQVTSNPAGINCAPTCSTSFLPGTTVTLTATPTTGWRLQSWGGSCSAAGRARTCSLPIGQGSSPINVITTFAQNRHG